MSYYMIFLQHYYVTHLILNNLKIMMVQWFFLNFLWNIICYKYNEMFCILLNYTSNYVKKSLFIEMWKNLFVDLFFLIFD